ncbi:MAG TPA: hypothetical protein P5123_06785, partial [Spirochaetota bacterium]|nr:hypothetical protein [Spirochaetota bacterium]
MKKFYLLLIICFFACTASISAQETSDNSVDSDFGDFDFSSKTVTDAPGSEEKNSVSIGGRLETESALSQKDRDLTRGYICLDLDLGYSNDNTEVKATLRGEKDTLRTSTYYYTSPSAYEEARKSSYDVETIKKQSFSSGALDSVNTEDMR